MRSNRFALMVCAFTVLQTVTFIVDSAHAEKANQAAKVVVTLTSTDGKSVQVSLAEIQAGLLKAALKGNMVSADSINGNPDGAMTITNPKIICDGAMKTISQLSDPNSICRYFGFSTFTSGASTQSDDILDLASVATNGNVTSAPGVVSVKHINCK